MILMRATQIILLLFAIAGLAVANEGAAAIADLSSLPLDRQPFVRYITTSTAADELERACQEVSLQLVVPSTSRQGNLDYCRPVQVTETLWRIDLDWLRWDVNDWLRLVHKYPYSPTASANPIVVRADWLITNLTDQTENDAYLRLVFGGLPKDRDDALARLSVDADAEYRFGLIQGQSGVSVSGTRWIENRPISRGYAWGTRDSRLLNNASDPLERPDGGFVHDGEEWIVGLPKFDPKTGFRGALQVYFLANGQGKLVDRAPVDLVRDHREYRGLAEIRNPGSCIQCHEFGLNPIGPNQLVETIKSGVHVYADYANYQAIEAFHLSDAGKELRRNNEDYQQTVRLVADCEPSEAVLAFTSAVGIYDAAIDLNRAAVEVYMEPSELKRALAAGSGSYSLGARLSGLVHGRTVPREAWEENYVAVRAIADQWRNQ